MDDFENHMNAEMIQYLHARQKNSLSMVKKNPNLASKLLKENNREFRSASIQSPVKLPNINETTIKISENSEEFRLGKYDNEI